GLGRYGPAGAFFVVLISGLVFFLWKKRPNFRRQVEKNILRMPLVGSMLKSSFSISCFDTLAGLLKSQATLLDSLSVCAQTSSILIGQDFIFQTYKSVNEGESLHEAFSKGYLIQPDMLEMLSVGERSGMLAHTLKSIADFYRADLTEKLARLATLVEPLAMIGIGLCVGLIALSIITPMYALTQHVSAH
ncbi:MAG: type II secretion system F family protein, partial [Candidatus Pacebacteria bacterium]|nr:type II secretion system F family protein [Candidatus Paceibacterota bacterium]